MATLALTLLENCTPTVGHSDPAHEPQRQHAGQPRRASPLSEREQEVLRLVAQGLSSKAIGRELFISASTVNYHLTAIFNKLAVDTRAQAVAVATQQGLL